MHFRPQTTNLFSKPSALIVQSVLYILLVLTAMAFRSEGNSIALFWPANGFLSVLLLSNQQNLKVLSSTAFLAIFVINLYFETPWSVSLGFACANVFEIWTAVFLMRRYTNGIQFLETLPATIRFFTWVCLGSASVGALIGASTASLSYGNFGMQQWWHHFRTWFLVDAAGMAIVCPAILAWNHKQYAWLNTKRRHLEFALCLSIVTLLCYIIFSRPLPIWNLLGRPVAFTLFPFILWSALRFKARGASTILFLCSAMAAWYSSKGSGPFTENAGSDWNMMLALQLFPFAAAFCSLVPASILFTQRKTEIELRNRNSRFGKLWGSSLVGIYVTDLKGKILEANDFFLKLIKRSREDLANGKIEMLEMATPEYLAEIETGKKIFAKEGKIGPFERDWKLENGEIVKSLTYASLMDEPDRALGLVMEIGALKRAEEDLKKSNSRYQDLLSSTLVGIFVSDLEGKVTEANDTFLKMIHQSRDDLNEGRIDTRAMATQEYTETADLRRDQFRSEGRMGPYDREWKLYDGFRLNTVFLATQMQSKEHALCMMIDSGELIKTKHDLRRMENRFKQMFESNIVGIAIVNSEQIFEEANDAFLKLIGYTRQDLESKIITVESINVEQNSDTYNEVTRNIELYGKMDPKETFYRRKEGSRVCVFRGVATIDEAQRFLVLAIDLSQEKENQKALRDAKLAAEEANEIKSTFLAHMSHEIRTPLNGILGMLSLLRSTNLDPEQNHFAQTGLDSGNHLLSIINQVLDFSKLESSRFELDETSFQIEELVNDCCVSLEAKAQKKGLEIIPIISSELASFYYGDVLRIKQILINLLGNAVKFSSRGKIRVLVHLEKMIGNSSLIHYEIADEGPGISRENMVKLFQPFQQGESSLTRQAGGTGLGLAISKELIELMHGNIWVESKLGKGSQFHFNLLLEPANVIRAKENQGTTKPKNSVAEWIQIPKILIVDDHPTNLAVATAMLQKIDCEVDTALDGPSALAKAYHKKYDLILMDCQMPGMDGFETTRKFRRQEGAEQRTPVIALTAHAIAGVREKCITEGMDDYIPKPFSQNDLVDMLLKWTPQLHRSELQIFANPTLTNKNENSLETIFNWERLDSLLSDASDSNPRLRKLIQVFLESTQESLPKLAKTLASSDQDQISKDIHRLKGSCSSIGAKLMLESIKTLESLFENQKTEEFDHQISVLKANFQKTKSVLESKLKSLEL